MDYKTFLSEVADWIYTCNQMALKHGGLQGIDFWKWATESLGDMSNKYGNNSFVKSQLVMLHGWLMDIAEQGGDKS